MNKNSAIALVLFPLMHPVSTELAFTPVQPEVFADPGGQSNAWGDFDGDGDLDLVVTFNNAPIWLYRNTPDGFENVAPGSGLSTDGGNPRSVAWGDVGRDGDLGLYIGYSGLEGPANRLYINESLGGRAAFRENGETAGVVVRGMTRQVTFVDYDADGDVDLYVALRASTNRLFRNDDGKFTDVNFETGIAEPRRTVGACWFDMDAAAGNQVGFLAHTYTAEDVEYTVNGMPFNESMILAAGAARQKIPLIMVSGDDQLGKEIARHMPWVRYATVKHAVDLGTAEALPAEESARRIERAARDAIRNLDDAQLPDWPGPYRFFLRYQDQEQARAGALVPGAEIVRNGLGVQFDAEDFEEGYRRSTRSIGLASDIGWQTALMEVIETLPNADALLLDVNDRWYQHWIYPHSLLVEESATPPRQYWGARRAIGYYPVFLRPGGDLNENFTT